MVSWYDMNTCEYLYDFPNRQVSWGLCPLCPFHIFYFKLHVFYYLCHHQLSQVKEPFSQSIHLFKTLTFQNVNDNKILFMYCLILYHSMTMYIFSLVYTKSIYLFIFFLSILCFVLFFLRKPIYRPSKKSIFTT
jgi:hypothetical protein